MPGKGLVGLVVSAGIVVAGLVIPVSQYFDGFNDSITISASLDRKQPQEGQGKSLSTKLGSHVYIFFKAYDSHSVRNSRIYINEQLKWDGQYEKPPKWSLGINNGWDVKITDGHFLVGENTMRYEIVDTRGDKRSDEVKIDVEE